MRRLALVVALLVLAPASVASATDIEELMERSRSSSYSAEQVISCSTPDGVHDAVVRIAQDGGEIRVGSTVSEEVVVTAGSGGWALTRGGGIISSAIVSSADEPDEPVYTVEERGERSFLGRDARVYDLLRDGELRARLVFDAELGALVQATTFLGDGSTYCHRRFISLDPTPPEIGPRSELEPGLGPAVVEIDETDLPSLVVGFQRLDAYQDGDGFVFAYYSDGFFSFAIFRLPGTVDLGGSTVVDLDGLRYQRVFTAGQVTYSWETRQGGMALVGDLPPDLHQAVLREMPPPSDPGIWRRLWRTLFG